MSVPELSLVPPHLLDHLWPHCLPFIEKGCGRFDDWKPQEVLEGARTGAMQLWAVLDGEQITGAGATRVVLEQDTRKLDIVCFSASSEYRSVLPELEGFARLKGCKTLKIAGRPGWARTLPKDYRLRRVVMEKRL